MYKLRYISMIRYGTEYGGWNLPKNINLSSDSIIYSVGVGEDISFDLLIQDSFKCNIILIDPTLRAIRHYEEIQDFYNSGIPSFSGDIQKDYISNSSADLSKITYIKKGLWTHRDTLKFYKQLNEKYVSHTLIENMYSNNYEMVEVDSLKNIMEQLGHTKIDLLKLDIEGSEIVVLRKMLEDKIFPIYICVEFDLKLKKVDPTNETGSIIKELLNNNYIMIDNNNWNCLFTIKIE